MAVVPRHCSTFNLSAPGWSCDGISAALLIQKNPIKVQCMSIDNKTAKKVVLRNNPEGNLRVSDFAVEDGPIAEIADGSFLVRNRFVSVDPMLRIFIDKTRWAVVRFRHCRPARSFLARRSERLLNRFIPISRLAKLSKAVSDGSIMPSRPGRGLSACRKV